MCAGVVSPQFVPSKITQDILAANASLDGFVDASEFFYTR